MAGVRGVLVRELKAASLIFVAEKQYEENQDVEIRHTFEQLI